jgi:polyisoprenoid-binding protein YceI
VSQKNLVKGLCHAELPDNCRDEARPARNDSRVIFITAFKLFLNTFFNRLYFHHMKNKMSPRYLMFMFALLFVAGCGPVVKENENTARVSFVSLSSAANEKYSIDKKESVITWKGSMAFGSKEKHVGYVYVSKGELTMENGQLTGGTVEIDMTSMEYKDKTHTNSPVHHLKDPDFFDVGKFPISKFVITKVASTGGGNIIVAGDLTIKGVTQAITFPAKIGVKDGIVKADGKVTIDRTQWGIRYKSGKFYDNLADETISDDIEFLMKIVAKK